MEKVIRDLLIIVAVFMTFAIARIIKLSQVDFLCVLLFLISSYVLISTFLIPNHALWLHENWMSGAEFIGKINGTILLTIIFYIVIFPLSLCIKIFNRKRIFLRKPLLHGTYVQEEFLYKKDDLKNLW